MIRQLGSFPGSLKPLSRHAATAGTFSTYAGLFTAATPNYLEATPPPALAPLGDFSVACWYKATTLQGGLFGQWSNSDPNGKMWLLLIIGSNAYFLISSDGSATALVASTVTLSTGTWYFICGTYDSTNPTNGLSISVNAGSRDFDTGFGAPIYSGSEKLRIGTYHPTTSGNAADGRISYCGFWNTRLSSGNETTLYNGGTPLAVGSALSPAIYYDMATLGQDVTGNGYTLTNVGSVTRVQGP